MSESRSPSISVIIPVLNDAPCLARLCERLGTFPHVEEIIVADGGSTDDVAAVSAKYAATLVSGPRGRGTQMNEGARLAEGDILWFLHADTLPDPEATQAILGAMADSQTVGGAFRFRLMERRWYGPLLEISIGIRSRFFGTPYGDQGYFIRREVFERVGRFSHIPIMEDVEILGRLQSAGRFKTLSTPIDISPRRWDREGFLKRTLLNLSLMVRFKLGAKPEDLVRYYRTEGADTENSA